jgi:5-carboxymethyl-2-hydroxymuconate isomerase
MPHITVEYSDNLNGLNIATLLHDLHEALAGAGVDKARIKTRAVKLTDYVVGEEGNAGEMVHLTLLILEGRDIPTKKKFGDPLYDVLKKHAHAKYPDCKVTLEIRDMTKDTYYM